MGSLLGSLGLFQGHIGSSVDPDEFDSVPEYKAMLLCHDKSVPEYKAMLLCHDKLVTAISNDPINISGKLLAEGIISEDTNDKMLLPSATPQQKATILINNVRNMIKINPRNFIKFKKIFSGEPWERDIKDILDSTIRAINIDSESENVLQDRFKNHLKRLYATLTAADDQFPPPATDRVFNLAMIKSTKVRRGQIQDEYVRQTIIGNIDDILREKEPIELDDILQKTEGKRTVVLLEGGPGCGKSTLSVFIAQQWARGELFTEYKLVILIRLRDPIVQRANCIAELLPSPDATIAKEIEAKILAENCRGVLFILDGWDELPPNLRQNSIFHDFIKTELLQNKALHESAVIVTSRPIASGDLQPIVSSRVEILGFTANELDVYLRACLKDDTNDLQTLKDKINQNPAVASSCYRPLNASIIVHVFESLSKTLPTTQFAIFSQFILNCIYRNQQKSKESTVIPALESLNVLPGDIEEPFQFLCEIAYKGMMENRVVFSSKDVPNGQNLLGLLQGVESLAIGKQLSYHFLHLSIQELLAALHIAKQMPESDQVSVFTQFFPSSRFSAVFQFYAAFTQLKAAGISDVILKYCDRYLNMQNKHLIQGDYCYPGPLLSILHCLCEAQNRALCLSVAQKLQYRSMILCSATLMPSDCFSIGFFLSCICLMGTDANFTVNLSLCHFGDQGCKYLVSGLCRCLASDCKVTTLLTLDLRHNDISHYGDSHLSSILKIGCVKNLDLSLNKCVPLHCLFAEQLKENVTLKRLHLCKCDMTSSSVQDLAEALAINRHIEELDISFNNICDDGIQYLAHALKNNQGLKRLHLKHCGFTSHSATSLAAAIEYLEELSIGDNVLCDDGVQQIIEHGLIISKSLNKLDLSSCCLTSLSAKNLAVAMSSSNKHSLKLNVSGNRLNDDGIQHLAQAQALSTFETLHLGDCGMTDVGLKQFAMALRNNSSLIILKLSNNNNPTNNSPNIFTDEIVPFLSKCLEDNLMLSSIDLPENLRLSTMSIEEGVNDARKKIDVKTTIKVSA